MGTELRRVLEGLGHTGWRKRLAVAWGISPSYLSRIVRKVGTPALPMAWLLRICDTREVADSVALRAIIDQLRLASDGAGSKYVDTLDQLVAAHLGGAGNDDNPSLPDLMEWAAWNAVHPGHAPSIAKQEEEIGTYISGFFEIAPPRFRQLPVRMILNMDYPGLYIWMIRADLGYVHQRHLDRGWEYIRVLRGELELDHDELGRVTLRPDGQRDVFYDASVGHSAKSRISCDTLVVHINPLATADWEREIAKHKAYSLGSAEGFFSGLGALRSTLAELFDEGEDAAPSSP